MVTVSKQNLELAPHLYKKRLKRHFLVTVSKHNLELAPNLHKKLGTSHSGSRFLNKNGLINLDSWVYFLK